MHSLLSPQHSAQNRQELFKNRSPSFRSKRIPSVQDPYLCSSNQNLKVFKQDSPSKFSEQIKRRKSQYVESNHMSNSNKKRQKGGNVQGTNTQEIINSIQDLKEEYRTLREAYKELIQERVKKSEELANAKDENMQLKNQLDYQLKQEEAMNKQITSLRLELERAKIEIEGWKITTKKIENDLYFLVQREKSKNLNLNICYDHDFLAQNDFIPQESEPFNSNKEEIQEISFKNNTNDSHILSFSLTSVIDQSFRLQQLHRRRKEHVKVVSDLSHTGVVKHDFSSGDTKPKKESVSNFKKSKKQGKIELQAKQSKASSMLNPLSQLLNLKSPVSNDKKSLKHLGACSTGKRRKLEQKQNMDIRNPKKKSKKVLQIVQNQ